MPSSLRVLPASVVIPTATPSASTVTVVDQAAGTMTMTSMYASTSSVSTADQAAAQPPVLVSVTTSSDASAISVVPLVTGSIVVPATATLDLSDPMKKDIAMQLVSSAENSSLDWRAQYGYIEDIKDGRGYTAGIIGFCSGTGDMLELIQKYSRLAPGNALATYIPALQNVNGTSSHVGLDPGFVGAWKVAAGDPKFQQAQNDERDRVYFDPAVTQAKSDGLHALGQFIYYDAIVMHGPGNDAASFGGIRTAAMKKAKTPAQGGDEKIYLNAFLDVRAAAMKTEAAHMDVDRVETEQRVFLKAGNLDLHTSLIWSVYGDTYSIL